MIATNEPAAAEPLERRRAAALEIRYELAKKGYSLARVAKVANVTGAVVSNTVSGRITCFEVARLIGEILGKKPTILWPGRYVFTPRARRNGAGK